MLSVTIPVQLAERLRDHANNVGSNEGKMDAIELEAWLESAKHAPAWTGPQPVVDGQITDQGNT